MLTPSHLKLPTVNFRLYAVSTTQFSKFQFRPSQKDDDMVSFKKGGQSSVTRSALPFDPDPTAIAGLIDEPLVKKENII